MRSCQAASRSESHLLVVTIFRDDPDRDKVVAVATSRVVDVTGDTVLLTTVVLAAAATVQSRVAGFELALGVGLVAGAVTKPVHSRAISRIDTLC